MPNTYGRQVVLALVNKSGGSVAAGDVVIVDTSNDGAFTTTTTAGVTVGVGIAQETIASNATGRVLVSGYAALVNVNASVTRGQYGKTHTVAKQATGTSARGTGTFCQWLTGGTTPTALVYPTDLLGSSLSDPMTTRGDIIVRNASNVTARLGRGSASQVLTSDGTDVAWATPSAGGAAVGAKVYNNTTQSLVNSTFTALALNAEEFDSDGFHDNSTNNTRLTVPSALGGKYLLNGGYNIAPGGASYIARWRKNGSTYLRGEARYAGGSGSISSPTIQCSVVVDLAAADYVELIAWHNVGSTIAAGHPSNPEEQIWASIMRFGS